MEWSSCLKEGLEQSVQVSCAVYILRSPVLLADSRPDFQYFSPRFTWLAEQSGCNLTGLLALPLLDSSLLTPFENGYGGYTVSPRQMRHNPSVIWVTL